MTLMRTTWIYNMQRFGWTETLHSTLTDYAEIEIAVSTLAQIRRNLLPSVVTLEAVRISDDDIFRDSRFLQYSPVNGQGLWAINCDTPWTSVLNRLEAGVRYRKPLFMRGIPDELTNNGIFSPSTEWTGRWRAWRDGIVVGPWAIKGIITGPGSEIPLFGVSAAGEVACRENHNFNIGDKVHFTGFRTKPRLAITFLVSAIADQRNFTVALWAPRGTQLGGVVRKYAFVPRKINSATWERAVKKNTGRAFFLPVGRRRRTA